MMRGGGSRVPDWSNVDSQIAGMFRWHLVCGHTVQ